MFSRIWGDETSQVYADTYYLVQAGIPFDLRVKIWADLLKIEVLESEEVRVLKKKGQPVGDRGVYETLKEMAMRQDCLAFRQIDEDIEGYEFPAQFGEDLGP